MLTCKNCYGGLRFDPQKQKLVCDFCGSEFTAEDYKDEAKITAEEQKLTPEEAEFFKGYIAEEKVETEEVGEDGSTYQVYLMTCPQCGGELLTTEETAATFCSYCGASVLLQSRISREKRPSYIIPFQKTKEDCEQAYRNTLKKALYAPKDMLKEEQIERFRGIYMPYWVYSFEKKGPLSMRGEKSSRRGDYIYTKHYNLTTQVDASYNGIAYDASSSFSDNLSEAIAPFDFHEAKDFDPAYLSGFYADTSDVSADLYEEDAKKVAKDHMADQLSDDRTYSSYGQSMFDIREKVNIRTKEKKLAMYPVWFLATRNKAGDRISYAVVNGQTGEVAADLPIDMKKLLLGTAVLAVPIFLILSLLFTMTPVRSLVVTLIFALVGMILANRQMNLTYCAEHKLDDRGYMSVAGRWDADQKPTVKEKAKTPAGRVALKKGLIVLICFIIMIVLGAADIPGAGLAVVVIWIVMVTGLIKPGKIKVDGTKKAVSAAPMAEKMQTLWKPLASMLISIGVIAVHPVSDLYYYIVAVVAVVLVAWAFLDIIKAHNKMSTRPLPQFGRRGGDENGEH